MSLSPGLWVPVIVWLLLGTDKPILVDTGLASCEELERVLIAHSGVRIPCLQKPEWKLDRQLAKYGVEPGDIQEVVLTHLHGDHLGNNEMFSNAVFYVHESEIPLCLNPPRWAPFYRPDNATHLQNVLDRVHVITDEYQLHPGVRLAHVGGHSPGSMAILVETDMGRVGIAGDLVHSYENLELDWPIGSFWDLDQVIQGMHRLRSEFDLILPNHDWAVWKRHPGGQVG